MKNSTTLAVLVVLTACAPGGEGTIALRVSGEEAATNGIPASELADGWSVHFDRYLVGLGAVEIASADGERGASSATIHVVDLSRGDAELDELGPLGARRWDSFSFEVRAPEDEDEVELGEGVGEADLARLRAGDYAYWIEGTASLDARTVSFAWGLHNPSRNRECTNGEDGTSGVVVRNNSVVTAEITMHLEHMFWDTLGSEQTEQRFAAIAAMADAQGVIDFDALAEQRLADLRDEDGNTLLDEAGRPLVYNPGSAPESDLRGFILAATRTQAHFGGEGLCTIEPL